MKKLFFLIATVVFVFWGLTINANTSGYSILQYCMDGNTQTPKAGVDVRATHTSSQQSYHATSDLSGWAVVDVQTSGRYSMQASFGTQTIQGSTVNVNSSSVTASDAFVF